MARGKTPAWRRSPMQARPAPSKFLTAMVGRQAMGLDEHIDDTGRTGLLLICHQALEALRTGRATVGDVANLEVLAMLSAVMCAAGIGTEYADVANRARDAVAGVVERGRARGGQYRLAGDALGDISHVLELHEQQLQHEAATKEAVLLCITRATEELRLQAERYYKNSK